MNNEKFLEVSEISDKLDDFFVTLDESKKLDFIKDAFLKFSENLQERYSITCNLTLEIFDVEREQIIKISEVGISCNGGERPYVVRAGDSFVRYLAKGNIVEIPHSYCPVCWAEWDFKRKDQNCPKCDSKYGMEIKLLIDSNHCPQCSEGIVSLEEPYCKKCEFYADPEIVVWG
ncbi:hypothetical protein LEP1GSC188_3106 [Leptospira weilii serovar Topaz str. LT2116]|uniref:Uncharacterized protein n=1 Tax=Leptospira weilii serovar Topaz str. LT2116 TaxID=1088540 RepID=M3G4M9_9LEPT|nr:hypothetical protein LEP1GSC188_3106 [Leptospira weilii serovar Topaz str. LT2116]